MRKQRWWVATLCVALAVTAGVVVFSVTGPAQAQSPTGTPRAGILTVLTVTNTVATPAMETPEATAMISIPLIGASTPPTATVAAATTVTSTLPITTATGMPTSAVTSTLPVTSSTGAATGLPNSTITVVGRGQVTVRPDIAYINLGVESSRPTLRQASVEASRSMDAVLSALRAQKVADSDIQASGINAYLQRDTSEDATGAGSANYRLSGTIDVTIHDLRQITSVLQSAVDAGANNIYGIDYGLADPSQVEAQARQAAVADALARARDLARLTGTQVGGVLSISEVVGNLGGTVENSFDQEQSDEHAAIGNGAPLAPSTLHMTMELQITYAIQ